jgi:hypothetical protein
MIMAYFRVPITGSLLIETDSPAWANIVAAGWTVCVKQATHGVETQAMPPPGVAAVELRIDASGIGEVTRQLQASIAQDEEAARENPGAELIAQKFCGHNYYVGRQIDWESFEFKGEGQQGTAS